MSIAAKIPIPIIHTKIIIIILTIITMLPLTIQKTIVSNHSLLSLLAQKP